MSTTFDSVSMAGPSFIESLTLEGRPKRQGQHALFYFYFFIVLYHIFIYGNKTKQDNYCINPL